MHREVNCRALSGAKREYDRSGNQTPAVNACRHHHAHADQVDRAGDQIDVALFHPAGEQRNGEGTQQRNEGGDPGDDRREIVITDVIMEEVDQRPGLEEKRAPHQENIDGEDEPRSVGAQADPGAF